MRIVWQDNLLQAVLSDNQHGGAGDMQGFTSGVTGRRASLGPFASCAPAAPVFRVAGILLNRRTLIAGCPAPSPSFIGRFGRIQKDEKVMNGQKISEKFVITPPPPRTIR
jgi:hypothetical protein